MLNENGAYTDTPYKNHNINDSQRIMVDKNIVYKEEDELN